MTESSEAWIAKKAEEMKTMTMAQAIAHLMAATSQYEPECGEPCPPDLCMRIIIATFGDQLGLEYSPSGEIVDKR